MPQQWVCVHSSNTPPLAQGLGIALQCCALYLLHPLILVNQSFAN